MYRKVLKSLSVVLLLVGAGSAARAQNVFTPGVLREDFFGAVSGGLDGFTGDPRFPISPTSPGTPDSTYWWNSYGPYNAGNNQGDNFGEIVSGYVLPPVTGNYKFYLRSDDPGRLLISSDDKAANLNPTPICEQTGCCNAFTDAEGTLSSTPVALTAGKKYYIQAIHVEGGGDDYIQIAWRGPGDKDINDPTGILSIPAAYIGADAPSAGASVSITTQPGDATATANSTATFTVAYTAAFKGTFKTSAQTQDGDAASDASIVWFKNGVAIAGQSKAAFTTPLLTLADDGTKYSVQVSVPGASVKSSDATLHVTADTVPPTLVRIVGNGSLNAVTVTFDGPVETASGETVGNYKIDPALTISSAKVQNVHDVVLATSAQTPATKYTVTVSNVKDLGGNTIAANSAKFFYSFVKSAGLAYEEKYEGVTPNNIDALRADPRFLADTPDSVHLVTFWEWPPNGGNEDGSNYGNKISGWFTPAKTGDYVFFCSGDDPVETWLSTDDTPANKKLICKEPQWNNARQWVIADRRDPDNPENRSDKWVDTTWPTGNKITLTAGKQYYMESLHTEGGGGDSMGVTFIMAGDPDPANGAAPALTGSLISTYANPDGVLAGFSPVKDVIGAAPNLVSFSYVPGVAKFDATTVSMKIDDAAVTPVFSTSGASTVLTFTPNFAAKSKHSAEVDYPLSDGSNAAFKWSFTVAGIAKDSVGGRVGLIKGPGDFTADAGGHTGKAGDYALDSTPGGGTWVDVDVSFLNPVNDTLSVSFWTKKYDIANGSAFWFIGSDQDRAFQAHTPWSDDTIYFDTGGGCCDGTTQRINSGISTFPDYTDDDKFWKAWHHFVFTKKADQKNVYIDGKLFLNGSSSNPISTTLTRLGLLTDGTPGGDYHHGLIDDFAIYGGEVSAADAAKLAGGAAPSTVAGLKAYFSFDDPGTAPPPAAGISKVGVSGDRKTLTVTYTGTLQSADSVTGPWTDVANATSPDAISITGGTKFYRVH